MKEQALSALIQDSYAKEIERVKNHKLKSLLELEVCKAIDDLSIDKQSSHPGTANSSGQRFARKGNKRGNSTLRRLDSNNSAL